DGDRHSGADAVFGVGARGSAPGTPGSRGSVPDIGVGGAPNTEVSGALPRAPTLYSRGSMLVLHDPLRQTDLPRGCIATIGNFDGMHVGHQRIVSGVVERARETGHPSAVITFDPHPLSVVAPDRVPKQILTIAQKEEIIRAMGVDALLIVPFTHEFSRWTADRF